MEKQIFIKNIELPTKKYVDDSMTTKQDTLTAGDNITIENGVISASGGSSPLAPKIYEITLDDANAGSRFFSEYGNEEIQFTSDYAKTVFITKLNEILQDIYANNVKTFIICLQNQNNYSGSENNANRSEYMTYTSASRILKQGYTSGISFYFNYLGQHENRTLIDRNPVYTSLQVIFWLRWSEDTFSISNVKLYYVEHTLLNTTANQTITAKKTFNTLPESSVTPTTDNQMVNKKYVDDSIASVDVDIDNSTITKNANDEIQTIGVIDQNTSNTDKIWTGTLVQYNSLETKDSDTYYFITDDQNDNFRENVEVITSQDTSYTITNLTANKSYKLGELTTLTISACETFDEETIIYFDSGSVATVLSMPNDVVLIGDEIEANKSYIIAILNKIAVIKGYEVE